MKPVNMISRHDPDNGSWGDCTRCCVASIFDLPAEAVPHFCEFGKEPAGPDGELPSEGRLRMWLKDRGFAVVWFQINRPEDDFSEAALQFHHIRGGKTRRGTNHDTVYFGRKLAHDPQWADPVGIMTDVYPQFVGMLVKA